ncbi:MAG: prolipoprotein diacylglyceryl transferase [Hyphomicrobiales bacterium]
MILNYINWDVNPDIFSFNLPLLGDVTVRYYGLLWAVGFIVGYFIMLKIFKKEGIKVAVLDQLTTYMVLSTVIGARLGHVLFYQPAYYLKHPLEIFATWEGGMASHGAAIGILVGLYLFSRKRKKPYIWILDRIVIVVALAGMFIRLGNLMNSEIFGDVTNLPWGFYFRRIPYAANIPHHPTQLYEAISYLIIFFILHRIYYKTDGKFKPGTIFGWFLILLFGVRFLIEFVKEPQVGFEQNMPINMGQILSIPFIIIGIIILTRKRKQNYKA